MSTLPLKVLMIGAGGIGGYYAVRLANGGHRVVVTARGAHLAAIQQRGLTVDYEGECFTQQPPAYDHPTLIQAHRADDFDVIVIALKSTATAALMAELADWFTAGSAPVLSLQNGVDNEAMLAEVLGPERVLGGLAVRIGGHIIAPGQVSVEGPAQLVIGAWPNREAAGDALVPLLKRLYTVFSDLGITTTVSDTIQSELWRKLVINNGVNPLSALTGLDTQTLTSDPALRNIVYGMMAETVAASKAVGVNLGQSDLDEMFDLISHFNAIKTSMLVDREKGRPLELDSIAGPVLRGCAQIGVPAPYTFTVSTLLNRC
jgi:2-dehydropantoate 2-reductase